MTRLEPDQATAITDSARHFLAGQAGPVRARQVHERLHRVLGATGVDTRAAPLHAGSDRALWRAIGEMGWLGICVAESTGGLGWGAEAACLVAEQAGAALLMPPLTAAMAAAPLCAAASVASPLALQSVRRSEHAVVLAASPVEAAALGGPHDAVHIDTGLEWPLVPDVDLASSVVAARADGPKFELRWLDCGASGVAVTTQRCVDGSALSDIRVDAVGWQRAPLLAEGADARAAWASSMQLWQLADAAYLCGLMAKALTMSLDYLRLRHQFGVPIGSFQALQHRAVDCHVAVASTRALVFEATQAMGTPGAAFAAAAAIRQAAQAALHVTKENIQFHGAVGFADEHNAGLYLRRAMVIAARHATSTRPSLQAALRARVAHGADRLI